MPIYLHSEHPDYAGFKSNLIKDWLKLVISGEEKILGEINIVFTSDEELRKINIKYLKKDYFTDVISFEYNIENIISGDIFISFDRVSENAKDIGISQTMELHRVMLHGLLHLLGYNDKSKSEKKEIRKKENFYLAKNAHLKNI